MKKYILLFTLVTLSTQNILLAQDPPPTGTLIPLSGEGNWWIRSFHGYEDAGDVHQIQQTLDDGFIITTSWDYTVENSASIKKINKSGQFEWRYYVHCDDGFNNHCFIELIGLTADGGFVIDVYWNGIRRIKLNNLGQEVSPYLPEPKLPWQNYVVPPSAFLRFDDGFEDRGEYYKALKTTDSGYIVIYIERVFDDYEYNEVLFHIVKYSGPTQSYAISGYVRDDGGTGISGASVSYSNGGVAVSTNTDGYYATSVSNGWSGESNATKNGYTFSPANYTYSAVSTDQTNQDFSATKANSSVSIAGYVRDGTGNPLSGVAVTFSNGGATVYSDANGHYYTSVSSGWGGTSNALLTDWNFNPSNYSYSSLIVNTEDQDYSGNQISLGIADYETIPTNFTVTEAYPNPFNPSTTIDYSLPVIASGAPQTGQAQQSQVSLQIYDITGKLINTLIDQVQHSGWHSVKWNGKDQVGANVPAGAYLVRIKAGTEIRHTKVMLLK